ncbi:hypothetical protein LSTR_LSTR004484 [Laodelphax striatellus]|uniref:Centrosome-associated protein 350 n=1 Tax=Laodelphax striatellus TaxID=195883 RepID=A0A482XNC0_LAOST|nr:hypothetical protein LSTR_LSTR004484 [Laodelphax striatellus]
MDFGEFMASWEPIPVAEDDNHLAQTTVPLSLSRKNSNQENSHQTWVDPEKHTETQGFSQDIPKENTNPAANASSADCSRKLKRKVMVLPPSESYRGFCNIDDIPNEERRPWQNLSPHRSQKVKQKIEMPSAQPGSKQVKVMRLASPERNVQSVGVKNRKICTLQTSPVKEFNVKMIKSSPAKNIEPQNKYRNDIPTKSTVSSDKTHRKSFESRKKVMKISSSSNRKHEDIDDHFDKLMKEAKAINSQVEVMRNSIDDLGNNCDEIEESQQSKPKAVKKLSTAFASPQKAVRKSTDRSKPTEKDDNKSEPTKNYDRQAAVNYMKQKKVMMKEKQAKELDKKRCEEENKQQKLQELQATRLKLLKNALKKKDATQARRNWEGPVEGESSPPPPLPVHRSNSEVRIKHVSRKSNIDLNPPMKSSTITKQVESVETGPSIVSVNEENCVIQSRKSKSKLKTENIEPSPSFLAGGEEKFTNPSSRNSKTRQDLEIIDSGPSFIGMNEEYVNYSRKTNDNNEICSSFVAVGENFVNPSRNSNINKKHSENIEAGPSFMGINGETLINPSRNSDNRRKNNEDIKIFPSLDAGDAENCMLDLKELGDQNEVLSYEVPTGTVSIKSRESIFEQEEILENNVQRLEKDRESVGYFDEARVQKRREKTCTNQTNSNSSSSFIPVYEDEMRVITDEINHIEAVLKGIVGRKASEDAGASGSDKNKVAKTRDEDDMKKREEKMGGDMTKVGKSGSWCDLLKSRNHSRKERKNYCKEDNESSDHPHTTTQDESISGGPINELTDEETLFQPSSKHHSTRPQCNSSKKSKEEKIVPEYIKALEHEPNPLNFITAYKSKLDMLKQQNSRSKLEGKSRSKSAVQQNISRNKSADQNKMHLRSGAGFQGSDFKENLTLKDLEICSGDSSRRNQGAVDCVYNLTDESSEPASRQDGYQPLSMHDLKLHFPPSFKSDSTSCRNSYCESDEILADVNVGSHRVFPDDRLFKAKSDSQLEKNQQPTIATDLVRSLTVGHSLATVENKINGNGEKSGNSASSSLSLTAPNDCVRVVGSAGWRENVVGNPAWRGNDDKVGDTGRKEGVGKTRFQENEVGNTGWRGSVRRETGDLNKVGDNVLREDNVEEVGNCDATGFVEPKRVCRERSRLGKATLPRGAAQYKEAGGVLEIGNVFSPAAIHLQFQAELSKLDAYEVGLQQLTDSERLHKMALKSLHSQAKYEKLHRSTSTDKLIKQKTSTVDNQSDIDDPMVLTSSHHSPTSSSLSSSSNPTNHRDSHLKGTQSVSSSPNHRDSRQKESVTSSLKTVAESVSSSESLKQVSGNLVKPNDRLMEESSHLRKSFEKVGPVGLNLGTTLNLPEGQLQSSVLEQTIATLISNPGAQVLDSLLNDSNGFEQLMSSAHALTPLFDDQSSCGSPFPSSCSNSIFDKCITYEEARSEHQLNVYKSKEKELINRVKVQVSWLEFQKKRMKQKGLEEEAKNIKKKQRGLILKSQQIREEIHRLMKAEKMASEERRKLLHQQKLRAMHQMSVKDSTKKRKTNEANLKKSLQSGSSTTSIAESLLSGEEASAFSEPKSLQNIEEQKRHLLEKKKTAMGRNTTVDVLSPNKKRSEEKDLNVEELDHLIIKSPKHTVARSVLDRSTSPFQMSIESENVGTAVGSDTAKSQTDATEDAHDNANSVPEELVRSNQSDSVESHVTEELPQYSESTFEQPSFTIHSRQPTPLKTRTDQTDSRSSPTKATSERRTTLSSMMIPIKVPLSPRLQGCTRKRYSSGSEDSITFSQNETFSEQSDIEIRLSALHEQLRQRKMEADRLRREQKRAQRERLKCKEQALLKQIQAYDAYIEQVKKELEQEMESPSTVPIMRPQIKQPRFVDKVSLRKPETVKPEPEKTTKTTSDEELSSLRSISEASSLETTIQSPGQRDSSADDQQSSLKVVTSSTSPESDGNSKKLKPETGETASVVSSATSPGNSQVVSEILGSKDEHFPAEQKPLIDSHDNSKTMGPKIDRNELEKLETSGAGVDFVNENWVGAAEFFKNQPLSDSPLNITIGRSRKNRNQHSTATDGDSSLVKENIDENEESVASSYSGKTNGDETLSEVEEILKESRENSENNSDSVESIVEQIETKSEEEEEKEVDEEIEHEVEEEDSEGLTEVDTEKVVDNFSDKISSESSNKQRIIDESIDNNLNKYDDIVVDSNCLNNDILSEESSINSSVDNILNKVDSAKCPESMLIDDECSVVDVIPDKEPLKTAQSALDAEELVGSALNISSFSSKSGALELNLYDSADDTFESDIDASENESLLPESKHSSNLSIPDMFPLPVAGLEASDSCRKIDETRTNVEQKSVDVGSKKVEESRKSINYSGSLAQNNVHESLSSDSEDIKSVPVAYRGGIEEPRNPEGIKSHSEGLETSLEDLNADEILLDNVEKYSGFEKQLDLPDSTNLKLNLSSVDGSNSMIQEETSVSSLRDDLIHNDKAVADLGNELIRNEASVANLNDNSIPNEASVANLEDDLIRNEANSEEASESLPLQSEDDVLSEVSEALSYNKESESEENLSPATKTSSTTSTESSSEFTVQKKAKLISLNSSDSSDKSNQDYETSFKEDEVIKVILVEKEKIIGGSKGDEGFQLVREEEEVEEENEEEERSEEESGLKENVEERENEKKRNLAENVGDEKETANKEDKIDRITDNILLNLLNESLTFSPKVSSTSKEFTHRDNCIVNEKIVNGSGEKFGFDDNDEEAEEGKEMEDIQTTAPFITALRKENEREKRKSMESVTDKVLDEFIKDATDSVLRIYGKKMGGELLKLKNSERSGKVSTSEGSGLPPGSISELNSPSKDSSFDSNDGSWLKDEAENELEVSGGDTEAFWLDEDMGLEHSCKEARELQLQRLQIEQEIKQLQQVQEQIPSYFYLREIPNKPPPPYTPPGQARAKIANDRIPTKQQEILAIVNTLTDYIYTQHSQGKDIHTLTPPRNLITREDSSQGTYKRFLFDLTKQIVIENKYKYEEEDGEERVPWEKIDYKQRCVVARSLDELKAVTARRVNVLYGFEPQVARENLIVQWSKKHNKIDKFLVNELQEEECEWTDFSKQELLLKNKVTADLLEQLIGETASVLERAWAKKVQKLAGEKT